VIEGTLVRLRPIRRSDLDILRTWAGDAEVMRYWAQPQPLVTDRQFEADLDDRFSRFDTSGYFFIESPDGRPIGRIEFERLSERERSAEIMILIGDAGARGKGYGVDAMVALLGYLFRERDLHRVSLTVLTDNRAAIRAYEKVGFVNEGTLREDLYFGGKTHDQHVMSMLRHEYEAAWPSPRA